MENLPGVGWKADLMHPRSHLVLTTVVATALRRRLGPLALAFWAGGALADADHLAWHALRTGRLDPLAAWEKFAGDGTGEPPPGRLLLHRLPVITTGLAVAPAFPWVGAVAAGLAFHRLLDDIDERYGPWWRGRATRRRMALHQAVYRRAGYRCQSCGASGVRLEAHHRVQRESGGRDTLDNLVPLCVPCHRAAHGVWM
jgi:hypothetical protein